MIQIKKNLSTIIDQTFNFKDLEDLNPSYVFVVDDQIIIN